MSCCTQVDSCNNSSHIIACFSKEHGPSLRNLLGPFPDEVILTAIDRILYYAGATKILHLFDLASTFTDQKLSIPLLASEKQSSTSLASVSATSLGKYFTAKSLASLKQSTANCTSPKSSSFKSVQYPSIATGQRLRRPRVDFTNPVCDTRQTGGGPTISDCMKRSLSVCSSAFQRLKTKLGGIGSGNQHQRLWTRLVPSTNGCQVYEVYSNADQSQTSVNSKTGKQPVLLFLIMPNGKVMPFEAVSSFLRM